jgi:hypothetical protein
MLQYKGSSYQDISPGSRGDSTLILLGRLLDTNADVANYLDCSIFRRAGYCLRGELNIAVLSPYLRKNSDGTKSVFNGRLPIHSAAANSSLDVIKFLLKLYP